MTHSSSATIDIHECPEFVMLVEFPLESKWCVQGGLGDFPAPQEPGTMTHTWDEMEEMGINVSDLSLSNHKSSGPLRA